jgi:hypothetical protein
MRGVNRIGIGYLLAQPDLNWEVGGVGDFNRDGYPDILWRHYGTGGQNQVWYMKGAARKGTATVPTFANLDWKIGGVGDFNRDGYPDILWRLDGTGGKNAVWYMKGVTQTGSANLPALADINWRIENH